MPDLPSIRGQGGLVVDAGDAGTTLTSFIHHPANGCAPPSSAQSIGVPASCRR